MRLLRRNPGSRVGASSPTATLGGNPNASRGCAARGHPMSTDVDESRALTPGARRSPPRRSARRATRWPWIVAILAVGAQAAGHLVNELVLDGRYGWLNAAADSSVFGRGNTAAIGVAAAAAGLGAWRGRRTVRRVALCAALLLLMVDDATGAHDRLRNSPRTTEVLLGAAIALVLVLTFLLLVGEAGAAGPGAKAMLVTGLCALAAALGVRFVAALLSVGGSLDTTTRAFGVAVEQGLDLAGWILVAGGMVAAVAAEDPPPPRRGHT